MGYYKNKFSLKHNSIKETYNNQGSNDSNNMIGGTPTSDAIEFAKANKIKKEKKAADAAAKDADAKDIKADAEPKDAEPKDAEPKDAEPKDAEPKDAEPKDADADADAATGNIANAGTQKSSRGNPPTKSVTAIAMEKAALLQKQRQKQKLEKPIPQTFVDQEKDRFERSLAGESPIDFRSDIDVAAIDKSKLKILSKKELNTNIEAAKSTIKNATENDLNTLIDLCFHFDKLYYSYVNEDPSLITAVKIDSKKNIKNVLDELLKVFKKLTNLRLQNVFKKIQLNSLRVDDGVSKTVKENIKKQNTNLLQKVASTVQKLKNYSNAITNLYSTGGNTKDITTYTYRLKVYHNKKADEYIKKIEKQDNIKTKTFDIFLNEIQNISSEQIFEQTLIDLNDFLNYQIYIQKQFVKNYVVIKMIKELKKKKDEYQKVVSRNDNLNKLYTKILKKLEYSVIPASKINIFMNLRGSISKENVRFKPSYVKNTTAPTSTNMSAPNNISSYGILNYTTPQNVISAKSDDIYFIPSIEITKDKIMQWWKDMWIPKLKGLRQNIYDDNFDAKITRSDMINIFTDIEQFESLAKYIIHNYNTQDSNPEVTMEFFKELFFPIPEFGITSATLGGILNIPINGITNSYRVDRSSYDEGSLKLSHGSLSDSKSQKRHYSSNESTELLKKKLIKQQQLDHANLLRSRHSLYGDRYRLQNPYRHLHNMRLHDNRIPILSGGDNDSILTSTDTTPASINTKLTSDSAIQSKLSEEIPKYSNKNIKVNKTIYNASFTVYVLTSKDGESKEQICKVRKDILKKQAAEVFGDEIIYGSKQERVKSDLINQASNQEQFGLNIQKDTLVHSNVNLAPRIQLDMPTRDERSSTGSSIRPGIGPDIRPGMEPSIRPGMEPSIRPGMGPGIRPGIGPGIRPGIGPDIRPGIRPGIGPGKLRGGTKKNISLSKSDLKKIKKAVENAKKNNDNAIKERNLHLKEIEKTSIKIPKNKTLRKKNIMKKHNTSLKLNKTQRKYY